MSKKLTERSTKDKRSAAQVDWPRKIARAFQKSVEAIIETGKLLIEAKRGLHPSEFFKMTTRQLPFDERTAQRLMAIARHPVLSNPTHVSLLPPHWGTLYELSRLPARVLNKKIKSGRIKPRLERSEVDHWVRLECDKKLPKTVPAPSRSGAALRLALSDPSLRAVAPMHLKPSEPSRRRAFAPMPEPPVEIAAREIEPMDHFWSLVGAWKAASEDERARFLRHIGATILH